MRFSSSLLQPNKVKPSCSFEQATVAVVVVVIAPLVHGPAAGVHEKVAHSGDFETELLRYGHLHFFRGSLRLFENGLQSSSLNVREHQAWLLAQVTIAIIRQASIKNAIRWRHLLLLLLVKLTEMRLVQDLIHLNEFGVGR